MARKRKKTVLLKTDLEEILSRVEKLCEDNIAQNDVILWRLPRDNRDYYYGRNSASMELQEFLKNVKAEYLD